MIPYITVGPWEIFGYELHSFFLFVVMGIVAGVVLYDFICKKGGEIDRRVALHLPELAVIGGFIGAHLVHVLFYHPELLSDDPLAILKIWGGYSSFGGFVGGFLTVWLFVKYKKEKLMPYADRIGVALSFGWIFGRSGCATAHDHPGIFTDFFLGVKFPDGVRHDLGLYELMLTVVICIVIYFLGRKERHTGTFISVILLIYTPVRFFFDFLRITVGKYADSRYFSLTPAQYGMIALFLVALYIFVTRKKRPLDVAYFK